MRNVFITIFFVSTMFFIGGCKQLKQIREEEGQRYKKQLARGEKKERKHILQKIKYIKDQRTDYCFAYYERSWSGAGTFGLAHVPCDKIPAKLLK